MSRARLNLQSLDDRINPVVWNNPWADPGNLTISFAPNGTQVQETTSSLFQELGSSSAAWQREILRAFQTWAVHGNINLSVIADNGKPFGEAGPVQGHSWYGDIRIGARPLSADQVAVATPFDLFGAWSGDILLNTTHDFNLGGTGGAKDLYTVMLQEAGHVFGLPNSTSTSSAMYTVYQGPRTGPAAADVTALQTLYGAREADRFDAKAANGTAAAASELAFVYDADQLLGTDGMSGTVPFVAAGDLTTLADVDYYKVKVPLGVTDFTVHLRTGGHSLTTTKLVVTNAAGTVLATRTATDPTTGDLTAFISGATPGATCYFRVEGATEDVFGIGGYRLAIGKEAGEAVYRPAVSGYVGLDYHTNDWAFVAADLGKQKEGNDRRWDATVRASVHDFLDADYYKIKTKATNPGTLVVSVWALEVGKLDPMLTVYDAYGAALPAKVLSNDAGSYTVQVSNTVGGKDYFIRVAATNPWSSYKEGNYFLGVDFRAAAVALSTYASGSLTAAVPQMDMTFQTHAEQLYHFALSATGTNWFLASGVRMTIYDAQNRVVFTLLAEAGRPASGDVLLGAGTYTMVFSGSTVFGLPMADTTFSLEGLVRSDPIGLSGTSTATSPTGTTPPPTTSTTRPTTRTYSSPYRAL